MTIKRRNYESRDNIMANGTRRGRDRIATNWQKGNLQQTMIETLGFPDNEVYKVEGIYDCAESQFMYDSVNFLITREGHVGTHINTDVAMALKQQIDLSIQRRRNANDLLAGL